VRWILGVKPHFAQSAHPSPSSFTFTDDPTALSNILQQLTLFTYSALNCELQATAHGDMRLCPSRQGSRLFFFCFDHALQHAAARSCSLLLFAFEWGTFLTHTDVQG
jgi:hypothetical protein